MKQQQTHTAEPEPSLGWDPFVRVFHWYIALFFTLAYSLEGLYPQLHSQAGYTVLLLIGFRLIWGFLGPANVRFSQFSVHPRLVMTQLNQLVRGRASVYSGHSPAGAAMTIAMLVCLLGTGSTGIVLFALEGSGPLAGFSFAGVSGWQIEWVHQILADTSLILVVVHILAVLLTSRLLGKNLTKRMVVGETQSKH